MSVPVVLIPGAGGQAWVWHLVEADLRQRGYDAFAVDLPAADESKGLPAYADAVVGTIEASGEYLWFLVLATWCFAAAFVVRSRRGSWLA